jgi:hypothetical protein
MIAENVRVTANIVLPPWVLLLFSYVQVEVKVENNLSLEERNHVPKLNLESLWWFWFPPSISK